jgi:hypothetical protein
MSSYIPLFIILFLKNIENLRLALILIAIIVTPLFVIGRYLDLPLGREPNREIEIIDISERGSEVLNYIACYIVPFISFNSDIIVNSKIDIPNLLAVIVLFMVICSLYMSSNLYYINPIITLFYDLHSVKTIKGDIAFIIASKKTIIPNNKTILVRKLSNGIYLISSDRKNKITKIKILILILILMLLLIYLNTEAKDIIVMVFKKLLEIIKQIFKR